MSYSVIFPGGWDDTRVLMSPAVCDSVSLEDPRLVSAGLTAAASLYPIAPT